MAPTERVTAKKAIPTKEKEKKEGEEKARHHPTSLPTPEW